jgi:site-specific DNA-methyltransferase (adenine-specific)
LYGQGLPKSHDAGGGWGTGLKPAAEFISVARKPIEGTVAQNRAEYGTGVINIEGCRVPSAGGHPRENEASQDRRYVDSGSTNFARLPGPWGGGELGRWPANLIHDGSEEVLNAFPDAPEQQRALTGNEGTRVKQACYGQLGDRPAFEPRQDSSKSAARFFYCAKASSEERIGRCGVCGTRFMGKRNCPCTPIEEGVSCEMPGHPTVKPINLLRYLVRLVCPIGGTVLDPFAGTGTTLWAAAQEGMRSIGIEQDGDYCDDIRHRMSRITP